MKCIGCDHCLTVVRLMGDPHDIDQLILSHPQWKDGFPCVDTDCPGPMRPVEEEMVRALPYLFEDRLIRYLELSPHEAFRALCGFGTPEELGTDPEVITALLKSTSVCGARTRKAPSGRTILDRLELDNGLSLHLASSAHGPIVFKVTRRSSEARDDHGDVLSDGRHVLRQDGRRLGGFGKGGEGVPDEVDGDGGLDAGDHRGTPPCPEGTPESGSDHDPGAPEAGGLQEERAGVRAGPDSGGFDQGQCGGGGEDVRACREDCDSSASESHVANQGE